MNTTQTTIAQSVKSALTIDDIKASAARHLSMKGCSDDYDYTCFAYKLDTDISNCSSTLLDMGYFHIAGEGNISGLGWYYGENDLFFSEEAIGSTGFSDEDVIDVITRAVKIDFKIEISNEEVEACINEEYRQWRNSMSGGCVFHFLKDVLDFDALVQDYLDSKEEN